jgi:GDPmannose 4,6-dehydratase
VVDHVGALRDDRTRPPLALGNLKARRDWGFAPDYVEGMVMILRQAVRRGVPDRADSYRDYVLGTGTLHAVWELVDRAFAVAGFELRWSLEGNDARRWSASFADSGQAAVLVDPTFLRPADPAAIAADPRLIAIDLGWSPRSDLDRFLTDMLDPPPRH